MTNGTFQECLTLALLGDRSSLGILLERHRNYLLAIANAELDDKLVGKGGGSDLVQQTFAEATNAIHQFAGQAEAEMLAWLRQILLHNIADFQKSYFQTSARRIQREYHLDSQQMAQLPANDATPSSQVRQIEEEERLNQALAQLPADYRQVIELRNRDKKRFSEVGEAMARSEDAARMLWSRAIDKLKEILEAEPN